MIVGAALMLALTTYDPFMVCVLAEQPEYRCGVYEICAHLDIRTRRRCHADAVCLITKSRDGELRWWVPTHNDCATAIDRWESKKQRRRVFRKWTRTQRRDQWRGK